MEFFVDCTSSVQPAFSAGIELYYPQIIIISRCPEHPPPYIRVQLPPTIRSQEPPILPYITVHPPYPELLPERSWGRAGKQKVQGLEEDQRRSGDRCQSLLYPETREGADEGVLQLHIEVQDL